MNLFSKIRDHGIIESLNILIFGYIINRFIYYISCILPINKNLLVFESDGDLSDNAYAFFDYLVNEQYTQKYKVIWLVDEVNKSKKNKYYNVRYSKKSNKSFYPLTFYGLARTKFYIYDHCNAYSAFHLHKRKRQIIVDLWHGIPVKALKWYGIPAKPLIPKRENISVEILCSTSEFASEWLHIATGISKDKIKIVGEPRLDYYFKDLSKIKYILDIRYQINNYQLIALWMPTFRSSHSKSLSQDYFNNETGLPMISSYNELKLFNDYLCEKNILLVLKVHHLQADLPVFKKRFSNILILTDENLQDIDVQLYQFIPFSDMLITDYSSVFIDYLVLNRPIIYTCDDYEDYKKTRPLIVENFVDYLKGYHVKSIIELENAIDEISNGIDRFKNEREESIALFHKYKDGNASKRLVELLDL